VGKAFDDMPEFMRKLKLMRDQVGAERILFGTDQPSYNPDSQEDDELARRWAQLFKNLPKVAKQYGVNFSQEEAELMLHGNAERILKL
jgi:predicted TIM-barrel fold metal-dependent hydrolase